MEDDVTFIRFVLKNLSHIGGFMFWMFPISLDFVKNEVLDWRRHPNFTEN